MDIMTDYMQHVRNAAIGASREERIVRVTLPSYPWEAASAPERPAEAPSTVFGHSDAPRGAQWHPAGKKSGCLYTNDYARRVMVERAACDASRPQERPDPAPQEDAYAAQLRDLALKEGRDGALPGLWAGQGNWVQGADATLRDLTAIRQGADTARKLAAAAGITRHSAGGNLHRYICAGYVTRERIGAEWCYTLTEAARARLGREPPPDRAEWLALMGDGPFGMADVMHEMGMTYNAAANLLRGWDRAGLLAQVKRSRPKMWRAVGKAE